MPSLVIPEQHKAGLAALKALSPEKLAALVKALQDIPIVTRQRNELISAVNVSLPALDEGQVEGIVSTIYSLYRVRAHSEVELVQFVKDLTDAASASGALMSAEERQSFEMNMRVLLSVESLNVFAKAHDLQRDHQQIFHEAKVFTDLRPVFGAANEAPRGMVLEYTLKITYHDGARHKEMYLALDADDIAALRAALDRAEIKASSLKDLLSAKGIPEFVLP
jgi:hypothetical protein